MRACSYFDCVFLYGAGVYWVTVTKAENFKEEGERVTLQICV